jgi:quinol monooxygenase YgiN
MVEGWDSDAALQDHLDSPHLAALIAKSDEFFEGPLDIVRLHALPVGDAEKGQL